MLDTIFPFGKGNVTKLGVAYFFATLYFYIPVYTLYLQSNDLNYVQVNSLWGIIVATMFLTEVPTGIVADRIGRKRAINVALGLQVLGEVIFLLGENYWTFALAAAIGGLGFAFSSGATEALMYDSLKTQGRQNEMTKAMGFLSAAKRSANLVAFSIGGIFVATLTQERFAMAIAATASAVFAGWLVSFTLREPPVDDDDGKRKGSLTLLTDGLALLRDDRTFRRLVLLAVATVPFIDYLMNLYQPRFVDIGVPSIWLGLALALASGLSIVGARYAYWLEARFGTRTSLLLVTVLPGVLYLVLAAIVLPALAVLVFIVLYGSMSLKDPVFSGHLNRHIESSNRATVLSLVAMGSGIYVALLGLVIGQIAQVSLTYAFIFMGVVVIAGSLLFRIK
jgi:predicted MFS family arabinose efflux permease